METELVCELLGQGHVAKGKTADTRLGAGAVVSVSAARVSPVSSGWGSLVSAEKFSVPFPEICCRLPRAPRHESPLSEKLILKMQFIVSKC